MKTSIKSLIAFFLTIGCLSANAQISKIEEAIEDGNYQMVVKIEKNSWTMMS